MIAPNPLPWGDEGQVRAWLNQVVQVPQCAHPGVGVGAIIAVTVIAVALIGAIVVLVWPRPPGPPPPAHPVWANPKIAPKGKSAGHDRG